MKTKKEYLKEAYEKIMLFMYEDGCRYDTDDGGFCELEDATCVWCMDSVIYVDENGYYKLQDLHKREGVDIVAKGTVDDVVDYLRGWDDSFEASKACDEESDFYLIGLYENMDSIKDLIRNELIKRKIEV